MESPAPVSRYIPQNSKKRVFLAESSSSGCNEADELELSPPINRASKPKSSKQKEVIHEIIDVDMDGESVEVMLTDHEVDTSAKGKEVMSDSSGGVNSLANDETCDDVDDDASSDLNYEEDDDTYYDDILYEEEPPTLESHFDHMDIPPGVEVSFPWLQGSPKNDTKVPSASTSTHANTKLLSDLNSSDSSLPLAYTQITDLSTLWDNSVTDDETDVGKTKNSQPSKSLLLNKTGKEPFLHSSGKSQRKPRSSSSALYSSHYLSQFPSAPLYPTSVDGIGSYPVSTPKMPAKGLGVGGYISMWKDLPMNVLEPSLSASGFMDDDLFTGSAQDPADNLIGASQVETTSVPAKVVEQKNLAEVLRNFENFKKFDVVEDYSDHHYAKNGSSDKELPKNWAKRIQEEWKILEKDLPDEVFVRVYEARMDLLRAVIIGAEGTPYHGGLFFFDVFFPSSYPNVPPHVHYHSRGLRINPNLYNCGKVCLSLLNTWGGSQKEKWIPGVSTMLQVLVSIQGLILNAKPYFNEPGYANMNGSMVGEKKSSEYNERTFIYNLQTMGYNMRRPPKHFEDFVVGYFCKNGRGILLSCRAYLGGAQVGSLVKGRVQDVGAVSKSCSQEFKSSLALFMTTLINQFRTIGAKDCEEFLYMSELEKERATAANTVSGPLPLDFSV
ncbi:probable ubiquitin-conjugating enzyme e2 26 [Phtheirospermum japonicum]|uniref:E2 ubiquitin-conjugating enzyme n=1 Tax=Phtheirospermum japonicum TaxID=374723 RepID=A0A830B127_9LAMI|nr:probable ubiquitin-conjugating enzyme e2 26 [Phtheirospermum japonicum]